MVETEPKPRKIWHRKRNALGDHVASTVTLLQHRYLGHYGISNAASAAATLAKLRRAVNMDPGSVLDADEIGLLPTELIGFITGDEPTRAETAFHIAITLYATHQQSQQTQSMHVTGPSFATAVRNLALQGESSEAVQRRFAAAGTAASLNELRHHTRGLVTQLRGAGIGLDYGLFADDIHTFLGKDGPQKLRGVWGRDYWRISGESKKNDTTHEEQA